MKVIDWVGYAVNPKRTLRNQAVKGGARGKDARRRMDVPLFRSEKEKEKTRRERERLSLEVRSYPYPYKVRYWPLTCMNKAREPGRGGRDW
jgi:hypothetical protein